MCEYKVECRKWCVVYKVKCKCYGDLYVGNTQNILKNNRTTLPKCGPKGHAG